jgi:hypothetical protein
LLLTEGFPDGQATIKKAIQVIRDKDIELDQLKDLEMIQVLKDSGVKPGFAARFAKQASTFKSTYKQQEVLNTASGLLDVHRGR